MNSYSAFDHTLTQNAHINRMARAFVADDTSTPKLAVIKHLRSVHGYTLVEANRAMIRALKEAERYDPNFVGA